MTRPTSEKLVTILSSTAVGGNTIGPTLELAAASSPAGSGSAPGTGQWGEPLCLDAGWAPPHGSPRCHDHLASSWPIPPDTSRWVVQEKEIPASAGAWLWSWQLLWEREDVSDVGHRLVEAGSPWAWGAKHVWNTCLQYATSDKESLSVHFPSVMSSDTLCHAALSASMTSWMVGARRCWSLGRAVASSRNFA